MQTFLKTLKYDKKYIFKNPSNLYETFCNAYIYYIMVSTRNPFPKTRNVFLQAQEEWKTIKNLNKKNIEQKINDYLQTPLQPAQYTSFSSTSHTTNQPMISTNSNSDLFTTSIET